MLREVDTHKPTLHAVYESALEIQESYNVCKMGCAKMLQEQWAEDWEYLHKPIHSAAYVLHPRYSEDGLQQNNDVWPEMLEVCNRLLGDVEGALAVEQYNLYQEGHGAFGTAMAKTSAARMDPASWWKSYGAATPQLQKLAMRVLSQPASAASSEQSWSEYDFIHSKKRNRLKGDVASKLVYVHSNLRLLGRIKCYNRYEDLLATSELTLAAANRLHTYEWDGDCSEDDECDLESIVTAINETDELDAHTINQDVDNFIIQDSNRSINN
jgi:hypothetical protein